MVDEVPDTQMTQTQTQNSQDVIYLSPERTANPWGRLVPFEKRFEAVDLEQSIVKFGRERAFNVIDIASAPNSRVTFSKVHFLLSKRESGEPVFIHDLSKNGTFLNGKIIGRNSRQVLQHDDCISLSSAGNKIYIFKMLLDNNSSYLPVQLRRKYEPCRIIGRGAAGEVRLLYEKTTCKRYAVKKIIKCSKASIAHKHNLNHPLRIRTEIDVLKSVAHPCVMSMKEILETDEEVFIILDYMEGGELTNRILTLKPMNEKHIKLLFYQMVLAVQHLHTRGITHRDLKPQNVLCLKDDPETLIKITDFGLSKILNDDSLMQTLCGTLNYVAPEILDIKQTEYSRQVDVWSLGVILFYMFAQELPFTVTDKTKLGKSILTGAYSFDNINWKEISMEAKSLIERMLTVDPEQRITLEEILQHPWIHRDKSMQFKASMLMEVYKKSNNTAVRDYESEPAPKRMRLGLVHKSA